MYDYLTLVRLRTELHEMAPNVGLGISKQIVRTKRLEIANSTGSGAFCSPSQARLQFAHLELLTLFKKIAPLDSTFLATLEYSFAIHITFSELHSLA